MEEYKFSIDATKFLNVLERLATAIEKQTEAINDVEASISDIAEKLTVSDFGSRMAQGLNIADVLSFCNNREELGAILTNTREIARQISRIAEGGSAE